MHPRLPIRKAPAQPNATPPASDGARPNQFTTRVCRSRPSACSVLKGHQREQQPQGLRKANEGKTDSYCLDRRYVIPQAEFSDPFRDQNVKTPEPKSDHRDAAESDHVGEDGSVHGQTPPV